MKFNRLSIFLIGFALMLGAYFAERAFVYQRSAFTHGMLVCDDMLALKFYEADMQLCYYVDGKEYKVAMREDTKLAFQKLTVRYRPDKPEKGRIYTLSRFWVIPMLWLLVPLMFWGAFVFTYFRENSGVEVTFRSEE